MAEACRCGLPVDEPAEPHWWPSRDPEPNADVLAVVQHGQSTVAMHWVRRTGGWVTRGYFAVHPDHTPPRPWDRVGWCWAGTEHPVIDATRNVCTEPQGRTECDR